MKDLTEGRIVRFVTDGGVHRPAVVTCVWNQYDGCVNLYVFPDGSYPLENNTPTSVLYNANALNNTWHWPPIEIE